MPQPLPFRPSIRPVPPAAAPEQKKRILSAQTIRGLKPPTSGRADYFDDDTAGLSLRITAKDARSWSFFYRDRIGRQKRLTRGRFPAVTLADACDLADEARKKVAKRLLAGGTKKRQAQDIATAHERWGDSKQRKTKGT